MGDSSCASESDNIHLTVNNRSRIGCNATTQTPEMPRHNNLLHDSNSGAYPPPQPPSILILRVDNQKTASELESEARALSIPDVVVEYIKDSYGLKENQEGIVEDSGIVNPGFNGQERSASTLNLREESHNNSASDGSSMILLQPGNSSLLTVGSQNPRLYHSMPRNVKKKHLIDDLKIHSQPSTPQLHRIVPGQAGTSSSSSLSCFPPQNSLSRSPSFGYRPLESETSAVYTITRTIYANGTTGIEKSEIHLLPSLQIAEKESPKSFRKFEYTPAPHKIERRRRCLQFCTDTCSLLFILPGIFIAIFTPVIIIPMFYFPITYFLIFAGLFAASGTMSVVILALSGLLGNIVWHYDEKAKRLKLRLHCGRGPLRHFWGNGFYSSPEDQQQKELIV